MRDAGTAARSTGVLPLLLMLALMVSAPPRAVAAAIVGKAVGIGDGDTLTVLTPDRRQVKVRLAEIDTPEVGQPYGGRARQLLAELVFSREVRVEVTDTDRYGRAVGRVYTGTTDVNAEMVRRGAAWVYREYSRDPALPAAEADARAARRGLWALAEGERAPPWEWRRATRDGPERQAAAPPRDAPATRVAQSRAALACEGKRTCKQMGSCEEARFYLDECGLSRLDSDGDGVPCEALCR